MDDGRGRGSGDAFGGADGGRGRGPGADDGRGRGPGADDGRGRGPGADDGRGRGPGADDGRGRGPGAEGSGLPEELRALGRALDARAGADGPETMVERVLAEILAERLPVPAPEPPGPRERLRALRRWARRRWRALMAALCGLVAVLVLTPPVRAAVLDWFGFAGAEIRYDPSATPSPGAGVPGCGSPVPLAEAERRAGFAPVVPGRLGTPDAVAVTREPQDRFVVSLCWYEGGRTVRLDERRAGLDPRFGKTVRVQPRWIELGPEGTDGEAPRTGLWFDRPHLLSVWLADSQGVFEREVRTAGPTLLWTHETGGGTVTFRLEGVEGVARATEIARSVEE
ncbi:hypothetical protein K6168_22965 [Streptomyces sp. FB2]|nr:hypothetical protein [Streptomyces sp. FB2]MCF2538495.1 hypothetical protein [Streptomyces sp. FB2]